MPNIAPDPGVLGLYSIGVETGNIAATLAADSPLFSFRWTDTTNIAVLDFVQVAVTVTTAITASVALGLELIVARSWSASDSGGTAITLTGNNNKYRNTYATSLVGDARISTTAALTAGTRTLDSQALAIAPFVTSTAIGAPLALTTLYDRLDLLPVVLEDNEGIIIRTTAAGPADGTFSVKANVRWLEMVPQRIL